MIYTMRGFTVVYPTPSFWDISTQEYRRHGLFQDALSIAGHFRPFDNQEVSARCGRLGSYAHWQIDCWVIDVTVDMSDDGKSITGKRTTSWGRYILSYRTWEDDAQSTIGRLCSVNSLTTVTKVYRDLHHCLQKASLHGKSGWSLGVCRGPCGTRLLSPVVGGTDSLVWSVGRYALHCMVNP